MDDFYEQNEIVNLNQGDTKTLLAIYIKARDALIEVVKGDITKEQTDLIVNAANSDLIHGGGIARAIYDAANDSLGSYLNYDQRIVKPVKVGESKYSIPGNLEKNGIKGIIQTVGPNISNPNNISNEEKKQLNTAFLSAFATAEVLNCESISIPAISSGIFGYPKDKVGETAAYLSLFFLKYSRSLKRIRLIDIGKFDEDLTLKNIINGFKKYIYYVYPPDKVDIISNVSLGAGDFAPDKIKLNIGVTELHIRYRLYDEYELPRQYSDLIKEEKAFVDKIHDLSQDVTKVYYDNLSMTNFNYGYDDDKINIHNMYKNAIEIVKNKRTSPELVQQDIKQIKQRIEDLITPEERKIIYNKYGGWESSINKDELNKIEADIYRMRLDKNKQDYINRINSYSKHLHDQDRQDYINKVNEAQDNNKFVAAKDEIDIYLRNVELNKKIKGTKTSSTPTFTSPSSAVISKRTILPPSEPTYTRPIPQPITFIDEPEQPLIIDSISTTKSKHVDLKPKAQPITETKSKSDFQYWLRIIYLVFIVSFIIIIVVVLIITIIYFIRKYY